MEGILSISAGVCFGFRTWRSKILEAVYKDGKSKLHPSGIRSALLAKPPPSCASKWNIIYTPQEVTISFEICDTITLLGTWNNEYRNL